MLSNKKCANVTGAAMTPEAIVRTAVEEGLCVIGFTDHNEITNVQRCAPFEWGMIDRCNQVLRGYILGPRSSIEALSQVVGNSRKALSRS
jgi:hypothetical protein